DYTSIAQFAAFLELLNQNAGDIYSPWSVYPLNQASAKAPNSIVNQVFHLTYSIISETQSEKSLRIKAVIAYSKIRPELSPVVGGNALDCNEITKVPAIGGAAQKLLTLAYQELF